MLAKICAPIAIVLVWSSPAFAQATNGPTGAPPRSSTIITQNKNFQQDFDSKVRLGTNANKSQFQVASEVADCLVQRNDKAAALLGGAMTNDPKYGHLISALKGKYRKCNTAVEAGVPLVMINGALAERLVEVAAPSLEDRAKSVNMTMAEPFYTDASGRTISTVARCLSVYSPGLAYKVLSTPASSPQENAALDVLYGRTPECGMSRQPSGISPDEQRSAIAAGLYHWVNKG